MNVNDLFLFGSMRVRLCFFFLFLMVGNIEFLSPYGPSLSFTFLILSSILG